ncbi:maleate cis-trans isomerase family protein [Piscibacillus halophilus]|uniref:Maleate cis-trans isomerase n=1 Tax=Piscibacillus halophilus TaxID=571933 RepID=A0A1H9FXL8_9BACI|nr:maleate cis-trans isomerase [Piscibacillus halophilus]SEQ42642.1 Maleate cis-trans isomerase [Piscibacillus halophilus]
MTKVGFLYPGFAAEDDYPRLGNMVQPPVEVELVHTKFKRDAHTVQALTEMGSINRLLEGAEHLKGTGIESVLWTSTSASFTLGIEGVQEQIEVLEHSLQIPASTTAMAFIHAADVIGSNRIAIAATYPDDIAQLFKGFLEYHGFEVVKFSSKGIITAAEVGTLQREEVLKLAVENDSDQADTLFIPDTALHSAEWIDEIEEAIQKPVLTANQVSFWEALRLAGQLTEQTGLGTLFRQPLEEDT